MITNYGIYNNHELDNTLLIRLSDKEFNRVNSLSNEMDVLYFNDEVVGYRIHNFVRYAKIKYSGIIFLPADLLIDVINSVLAKYNLETLSYKKSSGYVTKKNNGLLMVYSLPGTYLRDGTLSKGRYCTYHDLYIKNVEDENALIEIEETLQENIDFFKTEAN